MRLDQMVHGELKQSSVPPGRRIRFACASHASAKPM